VLVGGTPIIDTGVSVPTTGAEALLYNLKNFIAAEAFVSVIVPIVPLLAFTEVALVVAVETRL